MNTDTIYGPFSVVLTESDCIIDCINGVSVLSGLNLGKM